MGARGPSACSTQDMPKTNLLDPHGWRCEIPIITFAGRCKVGRIVVSCRWKVYLGVRCYGTHVGLRRVDTILFISVREHGDRLAHRTRIVSEELNNGRHCNDITLSIQGILQHLVLSSGERPDLQLDQRPGQLVCDMNAVCCPGKVLSTRVRLCTRIVHCTMSYQFFLGT